MPICTISIVTYNSQRDLERCLTSIYHKLPRQKLEVKVLDNASKNVNWNELVKNYPWVHFEQLTQNLGFGMGHNKNLMHILSPYTLILNPDTEFIDDSLMDAISFLEDNEQYAGLTGKMMNTHQQILPSVYQFPNLKTLILRRFSRSSLHCKAYTYQEKLANTNNFIQSVDWCTGAIMLFRTKILQEVGFFDDAYFMYFEDVDLCRKIKNKGYSLCYFPSLVIFHHWKQASKKNIKLFFYLVRSMFIYFNKWGWTK